MSYQSTLGLVDFSRELIETQDLDPVYSCVYRTGMEEDQLFRWLLSYMLFYHVGAASWFSEHTGKAFWLEIMKAAANEEETPIGGRWPRASERRHFRGSQAVRAAAELASLYPTPEKFMESLCELARRSSDPTQVRGLIESQPGFGGWASFKLVDLIDRVVGVPLVFDKSEAMYETPTKGAILYYRTIFGLTDSHHVDTQQAVDLATDKLSLELSDLIAPPRFERSLRFNEIETCLCKWKSHWSSGGKKYWVGKDIHEIHEASSVWSTRSETALRFFGEADQMLAALGRRNA